VKTETSVTTDRDYVSEFRQAFAAGMDGLAKAGKIYAEAIDAHPANAARIKSQAADMNLPESTWSSLEKLGRGQIHIKCLLGSNVRNLGKIKLLPYSIQERIFNGDRFELLLADGATLMVDLREIESAQADQLVDRTTIRSIPAQRAWLAKHKPTDPTMPEVLPYIVRGGKLHVLKAATFTRADLKKFIAEL
jgi:hypothetical protein